MQKPDVASKWASSGVNIDLDNLLGAPKNKATSSAPAPSMNQLASGGSSARQPVMGATSPSRTPASGSGPNYNISMMSSQPPVPGGMGMASGPRMGARPTAMGQPSSFNQPPYGQPGFGGQPQPGMGAGMNYGGGSGYGGYGNMSGGGGGGMGMQAPYGMGYGNRPGFAGPTNPGMNPMGMGSGSGFQPQRQF